MQRRKRNKISMIKDGNGEWLEGDKLVAKGFQEYFQQLFTTDGQQVWDVALECVDARVSESMNSELLLPITIEDVKAAVFDLGALKAPGPDGFQGTFYQSFWEIVNSVVLNATKDFVEAGKLLQSMNKTHIILVPKVPNPELMTQFRPFSLCNFSYKILSKVLANRLKAILPLLISHNQAAFVQG